MNNFLLPLLEDFSLDKIDLISNEKINEGVKPAFGSPGGKFFVAGKLISMFPEHKRYVEPFIGGGSVLFRKNKGSEEFINDKDSEIVSCFKFMQNITDQQIEELNKMDWKTSKETFNKLLGEYKESPTNKDPVYQFYRYVYIKAASDAGEMRSYDDRAEGEVMKLTTRLAKIKERLAGVTIENMDYKDFVKKYSTAESFTFLDPPYPSAKMNWKWCPTQEEFESFTKTIPGKWMVTYEVCDGWKEAKYNRKILSQYNLAAPSSGHMTRKNELVVTNYPIQQNSSYLSTSCFDNAEMIEVLDFINQSDIRLEESKDHQEELKQILKLYAAKRRGEEVKQDFEQLKQSFYNCVKKMIEAGTTNFQPEKLSPFALELFDKFTEYKYIIVQPDGGQQAFDTLKALKDSGIDYRGYKFDIKMKEAERKFGEFAYYTRWNKSVPKIEDFIIATDLGIDMILDKDLLNENFKESVFYIKLSKFDKYSESKVIAFLPPLSQLNPTSMPLWERNLDKGKVSILESTELEKTIEFSGDKLKGIFIAKRESINSDFWTLKK